MDPHPPSLHSHDSSSKASAWSLLGKLIGVVFGISAFALGASFILGGIDATHEKPVTPSAPAPPAPAVSDVGGVAIISIKPGATNPMTYDVTTFTVKSGQQVKITFTNDSVVPLQHNLCICKPGSKDAMMAAALKIMTDPNGLAKGFIPETPDILWHTKLVNPKESQTLEFTAPAPGDYPYLCTFPGHTALMNGVMKVE